MKITCILATAALLTMLASCQQSAKELDASYITTSNGDTRVSGTAKLNQSYLAEDENEDKQSRQSGSKITVVHPYNGGSIKGSEQ